MDPRANCRVACCCWSNGQASHPLTLAAASGALPWREMPQDAAWSLATHSAPSLAEVVRAGSSSRRPSDEVDCSSEARELSEAVTACKGCAELRQSPASEKGGGGLDHAEMLGTPCKQHA